MKELPTREAAQAITRATQPQTGRIQRSSLRK